MQLQLHSVAQAPRQVPIWPTLLDDLCQPSDRALAKVLGLSVRTVQRYRRTGHAPRSVCLALYWLTSYGRNQVHTQAHNDAVLAVSLVKSLEREVQSLRDQLAHVMTLADTGAANEPLKLVALIPHRTVRQVITAPAKP